MESVINFFLGIINRIRALLGLILPQFAEAADFRNWPKWFKILVHLIIIGLVLAGLYYLNQLPPIQNLLVKNATTFTRVFFLPMCFVLVYLLSWLCYFWWMLYNQADLVEYTDIADAWDEAVRKLDQAGIPVGSVPLYLVVGRPFGGDDTLFLAANQKIDVRAPLAAEAPIRVFAGPDAIFVCTSGASGWGRFCDVLANPDLGAIPTGETSIGKTLSPDQALEGVDQGVKEELFALLRLQSERPLTPAEDERLRELGEIIAAAKGSQVRRVQLRDDDVIHGPRRLAYLCRLINQARRPWCPINGSLVLVPWATFETDDITRTAVTVLANDLATARATFRLRYPQFVMVCDLEQATGFDEFRRGFPKEMLKQRMGQRLPLVPDRPAAELPGLLELSADWIRTNTLALWVTKFLRLDRPPEQRRSNAFVPAVNRGLFVFLCDAYLRGPRLARLLSRGLPVDPAASTDPLAAVPMVGGCYLAATGRDPRNQAFVAGVFQRLAESQSSVRWTDVALADDRSAARWSLLVYLVCAGVFIGAGIIFYLRLGSRTLG